MNLKPFTCRFCLVSEGKSVNLFDKDLLLDVNLQSWISQNFGLKIDEMDAMSKDVCITCLLIVYQTYFFLKKCRESEEICRQKSKSNAVAECTVSSSSGAKSNISRQGESRGAVRSSSTSTMHLLVKNEESRMVPLRSNYESLRPTSTYSHCNCLLPIPHGLDQTNRILDDFSKEPCIQCFQQRNQKFLEEFIQKTPISSSLNHRINAGGTQTIDMLEYIPDQTCVLEKSSPKGASFLESLGNKVVHSLQSHHSCKEESRCEEKECISTPNVEDCADSPNTTESSAISDDISVQEIRQERLDKKSGFHLEFIKFLNANVPKPNFLLDASKELELINNQKALLLSQRVKSEEKLQSGGEKDLPKDLPHKLVQLTNPSSIDLNRNGSMHERNERSLAQPNLNSKVVNYLTNAIPSSLKNHDNEPNLKSVNHTKPMNASNNTESKSAAIILSSSPKDYNCASLESLFDSTNDQTFNGNPEKCPDIIVEDESFLDIDSCTNVCHSPSPLQTIHPILGLTTKRSSGKAQRKEDSSCIKIQRDESDQNFQVQFSPLREKAKIVSTRPLHSKMSNWLMEPELSQMTSNSPSRVEKIPFCSDIRSNPLQSPSVNACAFFQPENNFISPSHPSVSHFGQPNQCVVEEGCSNTIHIEVSQKVLSEKNEFCIENSQKKLSDGGTCDSQVSDEMPALMKTKTPSNPTRDAKSLVREARCDPKGLIHQDHFEMPEVEIITENAITSENETIPIMGNGGSVKSGVSTTFDHQFLGSELANGQIKSSSVPTSYIGKAISVGGSGVGTKRKLICHDYPSSSLELYPASTTTANSVDHMPTTLTDNGTHPISSSHLVQSANIKKNYSNSAARKRKKKPKFNSKYLSNKKEMMRKSRNDIVVSRNDSNNTSFSFPCPICSKIFVRHELLLKHLRVCTKKLQMNGKPSFVPRSEIKEINTPMSDGKQPVVGTPPSPHRKTSSLKTYDTAGALRDETVNEIRVLIQNYLTVYDSGSSSGASKYFRCPSCFKLLSDWFEAASHVVLKHANLSYKWPLNYLFSKEKFFQLTGKCLDGLKSTVSTMPPPQPAVSAIQPLNVCEHCGKQFSSKSALIKHMIWYHNQIPKA